jgi:hypothetical protein
MNIWIINMYPSNTMCVWYGVVEKGFRFQVLLQALPLCIPLISLALLYITRSSTALWWPNLWQRHLTHTKSLSLRSALRIVNSLFQSYLSTEFHIMLLFPPFPVSVSSRLSRSYLRLLPRLPIPCVQWRTERGWGSTPLPEIPKFWQNWVEFPVP